MYYKKLIDECRKIFNTISKENNEAFKHLKA